MRTPVTGGGDAAKVVAALRQVGITRVRSDCPWNAGDGTLAWCLALAKVGITLCLSVNEWAGQPNVNAALGLVRQIVKTYPGSVDAIEGANEVNNNPQSWAGSMDPRNGDMSQRSAARAGQAYLYTAVKADPVLSGIPVVSYTDTVAPPVLGHADFANMHVYDNGTNGPLDWWLGQDGLSKLRKANPAPMPFYVTEWGVRTDGGHAQTEAMQAQIIVQGILTHAQMGTSAHYLYELFDDDAGAYGLFRSDGTPKAAVPIVAGLISLLKDASPAANAVDVMPSGATIGSTPGLQQLTLGKPDGSSLQVFWTWNPQAKPIDLYWSLDRAVKVDGIDGRSFRKAWGSWSKTAGELEDWKRWNGAPFVLRYSSRS